MPRNSLVRLNDCPNMAIAVYRGGEATTHIHYTNVFINPIALRKAKIAYNFGLSECNRVKLMI